MGMPREVLSCMNQTPARLGLGDPGHFTPHSWNSIYGPQAEFCKVRKPRLRAIRVPRQFSLVVSKGQLSFTQEEKGRRAAPLTWPVIR